MVNLRLSQAHSRHAHAGLGLDTYLAGRAPRTDHQRTKAGNHRSVICTESWRWDPEGDFGLIASFLRKGAQSGVCSNSASNY